ncbi:uncharacterized protein NDAI_0A01550 [Naumovozyma dairenensis CBS 421]|uniref:Uncharacterized protein n=1 Tax=Naumovozyma dairenensis (strain ATCC 10597 / BCRC 20456 / CBS 421 / NBRC 0211 / NRRL Y-12639) TaxID=1071378 RepID=G0W3C5_NAUDC|nr:hypothetical protein NDAI_0A01550 [Naumovozyma dairenensis CBS 421]CCD22313.1 hypothetical protein NDAI_0A01550 [Naumovozyma dairenensis CBS 421]
MFVNGFNPAGISESNDFKTTSQGQEDNEKSQSQAAYEENIYYHQNCRKTLDESIYNFLIDSSLTGTAEAFVKDAKLEQRNHSVKDNRPDVNSYSDRSSTEYLYPWWQIFWDAFNSNTQRRGSELVQSYFQIINYHQNQDRIQKDKAVQAARMQMFAEQRGEYQAEMMNPMMYQNNPLRMNSNISMQGTPSQMNINGPLPYNSINTMNSLPPDTFNRLQNQYIANMDNNNNINDIMHQPMIDQDTNRVPERSGPGNPSIQAKPPPMYNNTPINSQQAMYQNNNMRPHNNNNNKEPSIRSSPQKVPLEQNQNGIISMAGSTEAIPNGMLNQQSLKRKNTKKANTNTTNLQHSRKSNTNIAELQHITKPRNQGPDQFVKATKACSKSTVAKRVNKGLKKRNCNKPEQYQLDSKQEKPKRRRSLGELKKTPNLKERVYSTQSNTATPTTLTFNNLNMCTYVSNKPNTSSPLSTLHEKKQSSSGSSSTENITSHKLKRISSTTLKESASTKSSPIVSMTTSQSLKKKSSASKREFSMIDSTAGPNSAPVPGERDFLEMRLDITSNNQNATNEVTSAQFTLQDSMQAGKLLDIKENEQEETHRQEEQGKELPNEYAYNFDDLDISPTLGTDANYKDSFDDFEKDANDINDKENKDDRKPNDNNDDCRNENNKKSLLSSIQHEGPNSPVGNEYDLDIFDQNDTEFNFMDWS